MRSSILESHTTFARFILLACFLSVSRRRLKWIAPGCPAEGYR
jgi:hypothetical protein